MMAMPLVMGLLAAGRVTPSALLILPGTLFLFLGRFAAVPRGTRVARPTADRVVWTGIYFAVSAAFLVGAILLAARERRGDAILLAQVTGALGVLNAGLVLLGRGRNLGAEALAMAAVAAAGPLVMVLAGRPLAGETIGVGLLCLAYFLSALFFVRAHRALGDAATRRGAIAGCLVAHAALAGGLAYAATAGWLTAWAPWAFVAPAVRTVTGLARPAKNLRALGMREIAVSVSFLVAAVVLL